MKRRYCFASCLLSVLLLTFNLAVFAADNTITAEEASHFIGQKATVCGHVASTAFARQNRRQPTFLTLDEPYQRRIFTAVILSSDRAKFKLSPEIMYRNRDICIAGVIQSYRGVPGIIVHSPKQVVVKRE